jgi:hypothetical protein
VIRGLEDRRLVAAHGDEPDPRTRIPLAGTRLALLAALVLPACTGKPTAARGDASIARTGDANAIDATPRWAVLDKFPSIEAVRVITLPARRTAPLFHVGGPVLAGDIAIVSSSQLGFAAIAYRTGQLMWTKPAGSKVAPPLVRGDDVILIGDCVNPPDVPAKELLLACLRVVTREGTDRAYVAVRGTPDKVGDFAASPGAQRVWATDAGILWRRGDQMIAIDPITGVAKGVPVAEPPLAIADKKRSWQIVRTEAGIIEARSKDKPWKTEQTYDPLIGAVYIPGQTPMVRVANAVMHEGRPEILLYDIDATGSLNGQVSLNPVPGIAITGHAINSVGDTALVIRLDTSLQRDFIAGYAANALLMWTFQLPELPRPDPIGVAIARDAVLVFHDGDTLTVLPELSAPPTAPGAVKPPSENATP